MASASLAGCTPQKPSETVEAKPQDTDMGDVTQWVDAVSSASLTTNVYTNFTKTQLQDAIGAYQAECVVSTSNEDGTPNIAIFVPAGMLEESYIAFTWAENQTKANLERSKIGMMAFDVPNPTAESKELRHQGAVVRATLVEDQSVVERLKAQNELLESCVFVEIDEVLPVG